MFRYLVAVLPSTNLETSSPVGDVPDDAVTAEMVMALVWLVRGTYPISRMTKLSIAWRSVTVPVRALKIWFHALRSASR